MKKTLLNVENLKKVYSQKNSEFFAVNNISFSINEGETVGLVGKSGCGKSTLAKLLLRLLKPEEGKIYFDGMEIHQLKKSELKTYRKQCQIIFQDPSSSLNPRMNVHSLLSEPFRVHKISFDDSTIYRLLDMVKLPKTAIVKYPHEFSGGEKQRIGIARALALNPKFLICDEPTSALDISIQAQILNLLKEIKKEKKLTYLFIGHNLAVIRYISSRVFVMHQGKIVEQNDTETLFQNPKNHHTKQLIQTAFELSPESIQGSTLSKGLGKLKTTSSFV